MLNHGRFMNRYCTDTTKAITPKNTTSCGNIENIFSKILDPTQHVVYDYVPFGDSPNQEDIMRSKFRPFYYRVDFAYKTYTGILRADSEPCAKLIAQERAMMMIMEDYAFKTQDEAWEAFKVEGKTIVSEEPIEAPRPVLYNMLTGEKVVGPPGMSEAMLFQAMANGEIN